MPRLVLTRKQGESVELIWRGETVKVTFVERRGDNARLAFDAPEEIKIKRSELPEERT